MKLAKSISCIKAFVLVIFLILSNSLILSLDKCNSKEADDSGGRAMMLKVYGIPILTKDQEAARAQLFAQQEERRSKAHEYLKKTKIDNCTTEHINVVAYLQNEVQI